MTSELRPAMQVWFDASRNWLETEYPSECEAAAAVIEADREAVRAEQAAELAKWKALAETLAGALEACLAHRYGEWCDIARQALTSYKEQRDAS